MSGGVDSSVAAWLLKKQGYDVIGLTFRNWPQDCISRAEDKCCGPQAVTDARMVAHSLDIPYYVVDEIETFQQEVINYFVAEYKNGRTPNPCVVCNEKVKFGSLLTKAQALGAEYIATGHYARITSTNGHEERHEGHKGNGPRYELRKGLDDHKDQSYFLFSLRQDQLARSLMPLGGLSKGFLGLGMFIAGLLVMNTVMAASAVGLFGFSSKLPRFQFFITAVTAIYSLAVGVLFLFGSSSLLPPLG